MSYIDPFKPVILSHPRLPITAHVIPFGLNVTRFIFQDPRTGETNDVITGPEDPRDHWEKGRTFMGPLVGRYANRLPTGKQHFEGGEVEVPEFCEYDPNIAKYVSSLYCIAAPGVCLHGGPEVYKELPQIPIGKIAIQEGPLDRFIWTKIGAVHSQFFTLESPSSSPSSSAIFAAISEAGSNGFPGLLRIEARVAIKQPDSHNTDNPNWGRTAGILRVEYRAQIVDKCEATPVNITQHWGFNLSASDPEARAAEKGTTEEHNLRMMENEEGTGLYTLGLDEKMVPTGTLIKCEDGEEHDWLQKGGQGMGRPIKKAMTATGYDHFYAWGRSDDALKQREIDKQPRLILHSPSSRVTLAFKTNQSGTQFYNAVGQPDAPAPPASSGGAKKLLHEEKPESPSGYSKRSMVVLEFAHPHATFLHKEYQQLAKDDTILRKNDRYFNWVEIELFKG
jgi:aldose 1-epimerase